MTMPEVAEAMDEVTGVVLAGGLSSRLGRDKAVLRLHEDGRALDLLARSAALLESVCGKVMIVGRIVEGYVCHPDGAPGNGPAGGVATALRAAGTACLALSCDLPFMERAVLERLLRARARRPAGSLSTSYQQRDTGRVESLVAVYEMEALPFFEACLAEKKLKISRVVPPERRHFLPYSAEESLPFFNINSPADLEAARRMIRLLGM